MSAIQMAETGYVPDVMIRAGIRHLLQKRLQEEAALQHNLGSEAFHHLIDELDAGPVARHTDKANEQHYELPPGFFEHALGAHLKYSCCLYSDGISSLDEAEAAMLDLTCQRADIWDHQEILELGCGWGSLTLWMAEHYPNARITAVSNSQPQRRFIEAKAKARGLENVRVITCDMNDFHTDDRFDRVVSVEMFEHMSNFRELMHRIANWLEPGGKLFVHIFTHARYAYKFETTADDDWMGTYFFTGGIMPSDHLLLNFQNDLTIQRHWVVNGTHYEKTANHWLANMDHRRQEIMPIMANTYGQDQAETWFQRWRIFFMACAELWGYRNGDEWRVCHYLFSKR